MKLFATAALGLMLGGLAMVAPASAVPAPVAQTSSAATATSGLDLVQHRDYRRDRHRDWRRDRHHRRADRHVRRHREVCRYRNVLRRDHRGHRVTRRVLVCR
ncbi:hypothetical protein [Terrihabitans sp. B22-R8]|uniref:hypothetical protein n=1 Tax=Terrihabitans sp. B22-R8 TaxID=3425128 RepID=UPI00403C2D39